MKCLAISECRGHNLVARHIGVEGTEAGRETQRLGGSHNEKIGSLESKMEGKHSHYA